MPKAQQTQPKQEKRQGHNVDVALRQFELRAAGTGASNIIFFK